MRVDELSDRRVEARLPHRFDDEIALPGAVARKVPVLHGATAAYGEMRADGSDALAARRVDVQEAAAIRMPGDGVDFDPFHRAGRRAHRLGRRRRRRRRHRDARASR